MERFVQSLGIPYRIGASRAEPPAPLGFDGTKRSDLVNRMGSPLTLWDPAFTPSARHELQGEREMNGSFGFG